MRPILDITDLDITIAGRRVVRELCFAIAPGETMALIGESGSGKSMTAAAIMGLLPPGAVIADHARLRFDGELLKPDDDVAMRPLRGRAMSMVFQDPMSSLNPFMTVAGQIDEALCRLGMGDGRQRGARRLELLSMVELPDPAEIARRYPHELSGGQQQRVMLAMALAAEPRLLIADEPTSALDATVQAEILTLLRNLQRKLGNALLFITHDLAAAAELAHRIVVMQAGRAVERGPTAVILRDPQEDYTRKLVSTRRMLATPPQASPVAHAVEPVLRIEGLVHDYPARRLFSRPFRSLHGVSLTIGPGETLGILGESGSGKSTLARLAIGLARAGGGEISLFGTPIARLERLGRALRRRCQIIFQNPYGALNPRLTIEAAMREPLELLGLSGQGERARLEAALGDVGLSGEHLGRYPHQLSGGQRQRVCIARALLSEPDLLICDEIVSALDATVQMQVIAMLKVLQAKRGFAMMFVGHDIEIVRWVSDRIAVMHRGRIVEQGPAAAIVEEPTNPYTQRLMAAMPQPHDMTSTMAGISVLESA
ncbi:dipeptide ABC transporter ATP-binding protein [Bosea psychrotolerans]|uniref:Peptide/nickel transport system ATP-binding protein n=1 Tax=Bosea psychrotolerans TaxID=1871628 RepID=A0A2S4MMF7_9HYPH|nr:ABC transporter ATP-binding protein [Bosea psychrotolerans]POR55547.1 peptide/nickel transport system ATP-binding protein [Bosea psychrotolerans]